jgi:hypothetical protein
VRIYCSECGIVYNEADAHKNGFDNIFDFWNHIGIYMPQDEPRSLKELRETSLQKSIVDTMNDSRERFKEAHGRLLTEEEAIYLTSYIRKALKGEGKADEDIKDLLESVKKGT